MPYRPQYPLFSRLVQGGSERDPAIRACQIFCGRGSGEPTGRQDFARAEAGSSTMG